MGDGKTAVFMAGFDNAVWPDGKRQVGPVVLAGFEIVPGFFELGFPRAVLEKFPEGGCRDLDAVVEIGTPELGDAEEFISKIREFEFEGG